MVKVNRTLTEEEFKKLQEQTYIPETVGLLPRQANNRTAMLLAEAALRHARRDKKPKEIEAAKEALAFFNENPNTAFITQEQREILYNNISIGMSVRKAVVLAGIDWWTFKNWRRLGGYKTHPGSPRGNTEMPNFGVAPEPFRSFVMGLYQAEANCQRNALVKLAATEDWRAVAWLLERRFPDEFGKPKDDKAVAQQATQSTVNIVIPDNNRQSENHGVVVEYAQDKHGAVKSSSVHELDVSHETDIDEEDEASEGFVGSSIEAAYRNVDGLDEKPSVFMSDVGDEDHSEDFDDAFVSLVQKMEGVEEEEPVKNIVRRSTVATRRRQRSTVNAK